MAYIKTETVKEMRNELKSLFPVKEGWKISVTRENYSCVHCAILVAPFELRTDLTRTYESFNNYWIDENYENNEPARIALTKIKDVLNKDNYDNSDSMTDYFDVGHYVRISIGQWNKPFEVKKI